MLTGHSVVDARCFALPCTPDSAGRKDHEDFVHETRMQASSGSSSKHVLSAPLWRPALTTWKLRDMEEPPN